MIECLVHHISSDNDVNCFLSLFRQESYDLFFLATGSFVLPTTYQQADKVQACDYFISKLQVRKGKCMCVCVCMYVCVCAHGCSMCGVYCMWCVMCMHLSVACAICGAVWCVCACLCMRTCGCSMCGVECVVCIACVCNVHTFECGICHMCYVTHACVCVWWCIGMCMHVICLNSKAWGGGEEKSRLLLHPHHTMECSESL